MTTTTRRITSNYKHKREKMKTTKIMTRGVTGSYNRKKGRIKPQSKLRPWGSLVVENTREQGWGSPRSWLGGLPIVIAKREKGWCAWASRNSTRELYQQHHNHLSSKEINMCKILVNIVRRSGGGQKRATELKFHFLLPSSSSIEKTIF